MKVKFLKIAAGPDFSAHIGDVLDVDDHTGGLLLDAGAVVVVREKRNPVKKVEVPEKAQTDLGSDSVGTEPEVKPIKRRRRRKK